MAQVEIPWCFPAAIFNIFSLLCCCTRYQPMVCVESSFFESSMRFLQNHKPICFYKECFQINVEFILLIKFSSSAGSIKRLIVVQHNWEQIEKNVQQKLWCILSQRPSMGRGNFRLWLFIFFLNFLYTLKRCGCVRERRRSSFASVSCRNINLWQNILDLWVFVVWFIQKYRQKAVNCEWDGVFCKALESVGLILRQKIKMNLIFSTMESITGSKVLNNLMTFCNRTDAFYEHKIFNHFRSRFQDFS